MTAEPCAHSDMGLWLEGVGTFRVGCHDCGALRELGWSEAVRMLLTRDDAALRARAEQAERERDELALKQEDMHKERVMNVVLSAWAGDKRAEEERKKQARYDRLREAAREVVEGMKCWACGHDVHEPDICKAASPSLHICIHGQPMKGMSANWWDSYSKLAEEVGETTQKPAGLGGPSEGGR